VFKYTSGRLEITASCSKLPSYGRKSPNWSWEAVYQLSLSHSHTA